MILHTESYIALKSSVQQALDFVVLVGHAVPALSGYMVAVEDAAKKGNEGGGPPPLEPEFGGLQSHEKLREIREDYEHALGKFVVLSSFSYFEAYIVDVFKEVVAFHGEWGASVRKRNFASIETTEDHVIQSRDALREKRKKGPEQAYRKHQEILGQAGYQFPSDLLASYGIDVLSRRIDKLKAWEIPSLLSDAFLFDMSTDEVREFGWIRELRNRVAHGELRGLNLSDAMKANNVLRQLAKRFDSHITRHFMVIESV